MNVQFYTIVRCTDFVCLHCGCVTTIDKKSNEGHFVSSREHIFPESMGGTEKLERGDVCDECNHQLGNRIDWAFKHRNSMMAYAYQRDDYKKRKEKR